MLTVVRSPSGGQDGGRPRRRYPALSLSPAESARLRATLGNLHRAYGAWSCLAEVMGVSVATLSNVSIGRDPGSPGLLLRAARAASDDADVWRADIGATVLGEPVDVMETQDEDGAYGLVWTANDHEKAARNPVSGANVKESHRRAAARLSVGRTEESLFVVRWDGVYLGPEHAKETPVPERACSAQSPETAGRFSSEESARFALSRCNDGWRKRAAIERVVDPPGSTT